MPSAVQAAKQKASTTDSSLPILEAVSPKSRCWLRRFPRRPLLLPCRRMAGHPPTVSLHGLSLVHVQEERGSKISPVCPSENMNAIMGAPAHDLVTSQRPMSRYCHIGDLGLNIWILGEHKPSVSNNSYIIGPG